MTLKTTPGRLMLNEALPESLRDYTRVMDADTTTAVLKQLIASNPKAYREVSHDLMNLGRHAAYESGVTIRLRDLLPPVTRGKVFEEVNSKARLLRSSDLPAETKSQAISKLYTDAYKDLEAQTYATALAQGNPVALQVLSKARGNKRQLASLMTTPGIFQDGQGRTIPFFIQRSYAEGLSPSDMWAGTYGARAGVVSTKFATAEAGALGKQFTEAAADLRVTSKDCGGVYGVPVETDDSDNIGALLARPVGGFSENTVIDRSILAKLMEDGVDEVLVRSPMTCGESKGVCSCCAGIRETGRLPGVGTFIGVDASSALAERVAQSALGVKHGGTMGKDGTPTLSGFELIDKLTQVPKNFPFAATLAGVDGTVQLIEDAPQGGKYVTVSNNRFFVPPHSRVLVKEGDELEAGDQLSTGIVNPREVVTHKGIGEGRRHFSQSLTQAFREGGYDINRRNVEVLSRAIINNAVVHDPDTAGGQLPGDVVPYNAIAYTYRPRTDSYSAPPDKAVARYLEQPALHYTIGTRISRGMAKNMKRYGVEETRVNDRPPGFEAAMFSLRDIPRHAGDWMGQLGSSYLKTTLLDNAHRGAESPLLDPHPGPAIARGVDTDKVVHVQDE